MAELVLFILTGEVGISPMGLKPGPVSSLVALLLLVVVVFAKIFGYLCDGGDCGDLGELDDFGDLNDFSVSSKIKVASFWDKVVAIGDLSTLHASCCCFDFEFFSRYLLDKLKN